VPSHPNPIRGSSSAGLVEQDAEPSFNKPYLSCFGGIPRDAGRKCWIGAV
jgi:hypothetical protein